METHSDGPGWNPLPGHVLMMLIGILEIGAGLTLARWTHSVAPTLGLSEEVVSHLAVGFIAVGILTGTVEALSDWMVHRDLHRSMRNTQQATQEAIKGLETVTRQQVAALQQTTAETLLRGLFGEDVFPEIKQQFIQKPFIRTGYRTHVALERTEDGERLTQKTTTRYRIKNTSLHTQSYGLEVMEEWRADHELPAEIAVVKVTRDAPGPTDDLAACASTSRGSVSVLRELPFAAGESLDIEIQTKRNRKWDGSHSTHFSHPTAVHEIEVSHMEELEVKLKLYHPARHSLITEVDVDHSKKWSFQPVFLNYQGFVIEWQPRPTPKVQIGKLVRGDETGGAPVDFTSG
jgi:hypothetical protein